MGTQQHSEHTDPTQGYTVAAVCRLLARAAVAAVHAPSVLNTQPWRWRIEHDTALLFADRDRALPTIDPDGRLLTLSCGAALHHACVALAAEGADFTVESLPSGHGPDVMAVVHYDGPAPPSPVAVPLADAIMKRRSDRRSFADRPVPDELLDPLRSAAERCGAHLQVTWSRDLADIAAATAQAADAEFTDPAYRAELAAWIRRPGEARDGVPTDTLSDAGPRKIPLRDFRAIGYPSGLHSTADLEDQHARYGIVVTDGDGPRDWLTGGVALSAVLLTATVEHLATSTMSDLVEHETARRTVHRMLGGVGYPAIGVRIGIPADSTEPAEAPRRPARDIVEVLADPLCEEAVLTPPPAFH
ncbi:Acg family FMN-binding oxidoreductase [Dactylosporangium cerinum]|uniref:Acg family FMN-binding oxidoreductase n=1 Tax=Dactylosporangium cerinum TaxID=1434730 RepID=A0ABV9W5H0_9ACTN